MNNTDLIIDYDVFLDNYDFFRTSSDIPIDDFFNSLNSLINPNYNKESMQRLARYKEKVKNVENDLLSEDQKEKWAYNQLTASLRLMLAILYADRLIIKNDTHLDKLKNGTGKVLFYPHYESYMSIIPLLAAQGVKFTVLMDETMTNFWNEVIKKVSYGKNIKLYGIQNKKSIINVLHDIKQGYNLMMYPDFSVGEIPNLYTTFLSKPAYVPKGPVKIAKKLKTELIPVCINYKEDDLLPTICLEEPINYHDTNEASLNMMKYMEKIISTDLSKWWCWEIYNDMILKK